MGKTSGNKTYKGKGRGGKGKSQNNNYQDKAMRREYNKGRSSADEILSNRMGKGDGVTTIENLKSGPNDASFYIPNNQMAKDVLTLPEFINSGNPVNVRNVTKGLPSTLSVPGVTVFHVVDTIPGGTGGIDSPINRAGSDLYQAIQAANSRPPQYGMPLLMMYLIAHGSLLGIYQFITRVYGTSTRYSYMDMYTPQALITAMGIDYDDLRGNLANYRTQINQLAQAMAALVIPSNFRYLDRQVWLYSGIYTDSDTAKAQYYMYNPVGFFQWNEGKGDDPAGNAGLTYLSYDNFTSLQPDGPGGVKLKAPLSAIIDKAWDMLNALRDSDDIRNIGADLIKAFGIGAMYKINPIAETFTITPSYNREVLSQMENAFIYPELSLNKNNQVTQYIVQNPGIDGTALSAQTLELYNLTLQFQYGNIWQQITTNETTPQNLWGQMEPENYILNFHESSVSSELLLTSSRFSTAVPILPLESNAYSFTLQPQTTAIIAGATSYFYFKQSDGSITLNSRDFSTHNLISQTNAATGFAAMANIAQLWSAFDWMPYTDFLVYTGNGVSDSWKLNLTPFYMWDIDNYYMIGKTLLENVNYMANVGLFQPRGLAGTATI